MAVTCTVQGERRYRYYVCRTPPDYVCRTPPGQQDDRCAGRCLAAEGIERSVVEQLRKVQPPGMRRLLQAAAAGEATSGRAGLRTLLGSIVEAVIYEAATAEVTIRLRAPQGGRRAQ